MIGPFFFAVVIIILSEPRNDAAGSTSAVRHDLYTILGRKANKTFLFLNWFLAIWKILAKAVQ